MKKYRVRLKNNSWLSFDEETGEIKLPEHFGVDLMYNNDLMQIPNKIIENTILMKQAGDKLTNKINELQDRIDKALEYINNNSLYEEEYDYDYEENIHLSGINDTKARNDLLNILKGDNK